MSGTPETNRTSDLPLRRGLLYPLSYRGDRERKGNDFTGTIHRRSFCGLKRESVNNLGFSDRNDL